jgi:hypothetical protein
VIIFAALFDLLQPLKILGLFLTEGVQSKRNDCAIKAVFAGGLENPRDLLHIGVLLQTPTENPNESIREPFRRADV